MAVLRTLRLYPSGWRGIPSALQALALIRLMGYVMYLLLEWQSGLLIAVPVKPILGMLNVRVLW